MTTELSTRAPAGPVDAPAGSVDDLVGRTPLLDVRLPGLGASVRLLAKLEMANPLSSVKDRAALFMMRAAEEAGLLPPAGGTVIECSSGSTGISLAALCARRGHRCLIVMPDNATEERRLILRELGAEVHLVPAGDGLMAAWAYAEELQRTVPGSWVPHQDRNPANPAAHYATTGPEIWQALGDRIDVLVCGVGTGGTLTGTARYLKERTALHVVAVEPARSAVLSGGEAGPHGIPGIGAGYVSEITDLSLVDEVVAVTDEAAAATTREITRATGVPVGVSSGAAAWAARTVTGRSRWADATVVTVFPDSGERYLSTAR
ncbi:PLP-dependent cysteine synthase family protein [Streptomyces zaomyceticus]|uniref:PLP-dependent cysteine synthase family protein n=1 Tax=Streptomyces zaomyceticus TaxID=68286 RepID=UPI0016793B16|nr:cysteine synthase family protein [Streptomyces zaomyceticus]GHG38425.1 O-acetylserine sulfhydrylase [Streptomyces zaomyceticus]